MFFELIFNAESEKNPCITKAIVIMILGGSGKTLFIQITQPNCTAAHDFGRCILCRSLSYFCYFIPFEHSLSDIFFLQLRERFIMKSINDQDGFCLIRYILVGGCH